MSCFVREKVIFLVQSFVADVDHTLYYSLFVYLRDLISVSAQSVECCVVAISSLAQVQHPPLLFEVNEFQV